MGTGISLHLVLCLFVWYYLGERQPRAPYVTRFAFGYTNYAVVQATWKAGPILVEHETGPFAAYVA